MKKYLLASNREPTKDQSKDTTKVKLGELMNFIGVIVLWAKSYLLEKKWLKDSCIPKAHPCCLHDFHEAWLVWAFFRQFSWSEHLSSAVIICIFFRKEEPTAFGQFQRLPETSGLFSFWVSKGFPRGWNVSLLIRIFWILNSFLEEIATQ